MYKNEFSDLTLQKLDEFYKQNPSLLIKEEFDITGIKRETLLYQSNKIIRGKILIYLNEIHFELKHSSKLIPYSQWNKRHNLESISKLNLDEKVRYGEFSFPSNNEGVLLFEKLIDFSKNTISFIQEFKRNEEIRIEEEIKKKEQDRVLKLDSLQKSIISSLDKDNNGEVDLIDGETFNKLLNKNQKSIIEIDKNYIQKFVKISMYLKTKKSNIQKIFDSIKDTKNDTELNELVNLLKNQIHTYELLVFHSISMITSLVESDLISFYEIYECFDQLGVFNSNWENDVSGKLSNIGKGIKDLMYSIYHMEQSIVNSLDNLSYVTQDSFQDLRNSIDSQLSSIDSSIQCNNLLTGIQTYQMYKINQNTKRIN
jgi:hypothetical protein